MILTLFTAYVLATAGQTCFVNETNEQLAIVVSELAEEDGIKFYRFDLEPHASRCLTVVSSRGNAFVSHAGYLHEQSEDPKLKAHCPLIASGEAVRLVFAPVNGALACAREG